MFHSSGFDLSRGGMALRTPASVLGLSGCPARELHEGSFSQTLRQLSGDFLQLGSTSRESMSLMAASS